MEDLGFLTTFANTLTRTGRFPSASAIDATLRTRSRIILQTSLRLAMSFAQKTNVSESMGSPSSVCGAPRR